MNRQDVEDELLAEGIANDEIDLYIDLIMHSYQQIRDWIAVKGDDNIRRKAGIL